MQGKQNEKKVHTEAHLNIGFWNANRFKSQEKHHDVNQSMELLNIDAMSVTETHVRKDENVDL